MKIARPKVIVILSWCAGCMLSCSEATPKNNAPVAAAPADLNSITTKLPEAPGYQSFQQNCMSCHSARYVQNQPGFPEKTWRAIVTKMQKNYGAPVPDSSVNEIVQYLVAIKGKR